MRIVLALALALAPFAVLAQESAEVTVDSNAPPIPGTGVKLEGLDKITARVFQMEIGIGEIGVYETLEVEADACFASADTELPERAAFLKVSEHRPNRAATDVFSGWMFASSPSVSAMEHPVYDLWVVDCLGFETEISDEAVPLAPPASTGEAGATDSQGNLLD